VSTRTLAAVVVAAAVSASATTALIQLSFGDVAGAAKPPANTTTNQQLHLQTTVAQKQLSTEEKILSQLKTFRTHTETSLATLNSNTTKIAASSANIDQHGSDALTPLNSLAADGHLLVDSAPGGFQVAGTFSGFIPKLLSVNDSLCRGAQLTAFGNNPDEPNPSFGC
jgi:hypothetical protein